VDMEKYRVVFVEEATEHLAEMSRALLELEKDPAHRDAIDRVFRMAHSIKGMAASLDYASVTEVAHRLEDRMQAVRSAGAVRGGAEAGLLFRGLETLERMVAAVRETGEPPPPEPDVVAALSAPPPAPAPPADPSDPRKKKVRTKPA